MMFAMRRNRTSLLTSILVGTILLVACVISACGNDGLLPAADRSPQPTSGTVRMKIVTNRDYGFRVAYPAGWVSSSWKRPTSSSPTTPLLYMTAFADPNGAQSKGTYVDAEQVAVYALSKPLTPSQLTRAIANRIIGGVMLADLPKATSYDTELKPTDVHGVPGWHISYEYEVNGQTVTAVSVLLARGARAYWVTQQASTYTWRTVSPTLLTCLAQFRLLEGG
jgi:hypothetical protein